MNAGAKAVKEKSIREYYKNPNKCKCCNKIIEIKTNAYEAKRKKFCDHSCAANFNNKKRGFKNHSKGFCKNCSKEIRGTNKFCSKKCVDIYKYKQYIERWKNGEESGVTGKRGTSTYIKRYLIEKYGEKCGVCNWNKINPKTNKIPITLHHKNGIWYDNREENIELLCPNCHSLTENYGGANKGNGRKNRYL
jgi:hypothetical protein